MDALRRHPAVRGRRRLAIDNCDHLNCDPFGSLDALTGVPGGAIASGWSMDPNSTSSTAVHFYSDGVYVRADTAALNRSDVDAVYHEGAKYGYATLLRLPAGSHNVCAFAINLGAGSVNTQLGCKVVQVSAGTVVPLTPTRLLDTRSGLGAPAARVGPGGTLRLQILGRAGVPATGVSAVVLNVTVTGSSAPGYLTAYPGGTAKPTASNLNFVAGQTVPNLVMVPIGADGTVALTNGSTSSTHLVADVAGYVVGGAPTDPGTFGALSPNRLLDTRSGTGALAAPVPAHGTVALQVLSRGGVPATGVRAVVLNVTVTSARASGYVSAYPSGTAVPTASNLNFAAGQTVPNLVVVPVGSDGKIALRNGSSGSIQLIADVAGYFRAGLPIVSGASLPSDLCVSWIRALASEPPLHRSHPGEPSDFRSSAEEASQAPGSPQ